jgi:hypothetical protein
MNVKLVTVLAAACPSVDIGEVKLWKFSQEQCLAKNVDLGSSRTWLLNPEAHFRLRDQLVIRSLEECYPRSIVLTIPADLL